MKDDSSFITSGLSTDHIKNFKACNGVKSVKRIKK